MTIDLHGGDADMTVDEFYREWYDPSDYIVAHTSGSTGVPKEIRLKKSDMRASAMSTNEFFGIDKDSILAIPLSLSYIAGKMMAVRALMAGCKLNAISPSNAFEYDGVCDLLAIVPSQAPWLLQHPQWAKTTRNVIVGGASLSPKLSSQLVDAGFNAYATYGMTETCSHVALSKLSDNDGVFSAMPGVTFEADERGCLVIRAKRLSVGALVTNDIVELLDSTRFIWKERADFVINSGGIKIFPSEIEKLLDDVIPVPFYITKTNDDKWGERPVLVIESKKPLEKLDEKLKSALPSLFMPKFVSYSPVFSRSEGGKIIKKTCK